MKNIIAIIGFIYCYSSGKICSDIELKNLKEGDGKTCFKCIYKFDLVKKIARKIFRNNFR